MCGHSLMRMSTMHRGYWDYLRRTIQHVPLNILFGHEPLDSSAPLNINARKGRCHLGKCSCLIILAEKIDSTKIFRYKIRPRSFNTFVGAFPSISSTNTSLHQQTFGPRLHRADRHPKCFPAGRPARKSSPLKQRKTFFRPQSRGFVQPNGGGEPPSSSKWGVILGWNPAQFRCTNFWTTHPE